MSNLRAEQRRALRAMNDPWLFLRPVQPANNRAARRKGVTVIDVAEDGRQVAVTVRVRRGRPEVLKVVPL